METLAQTDSAVAALDGIMASLRLRKSAVPVLLAALKKQRGQEAEISFNHDLSHSMIISMSGSDRLCLAESPNVGEQPDVNVLLPHLSPELVQRVLNNRSRG